MADTVADKKIAAFPRNAMFCAKSDDLERANRAFGGLSDAQLDQEYGQSGKTCRQVWEVYKVHRAEWDEASRFLEDVLSARGL